MKLSNKQFGLASWLITLSLWCAYGTLDSYSGLNIWYVIFSFIFGFGGTILLMVALITQYDEHN